MTSAEPTSRSPTTPTHEPGAGIARAAAVSALVLVGATFFLISPPPGKTYPGAIPWSDLSLLRSVTELMSLGGLFATVRGVEIKDLAFQLAAAVGLALLGAQMLVTGGGGRRSRAEKIAGYAQVLLAGWVLLSLLSSLWSGEPRLSAGQAALYALGVGWAVGLGATFDRRDLARFLHGLLTISALGAALCVWYYYERNPYHRPGFPLGNPTVLAATILPGILVAGAVLGHAIWESLRARRVLVGRAAVGALVALVPLLWCLALTRARGALLALVIGVAVVTVSQLGRRARWLIGSVFLIGLVSVGTWWFYASRLDVTMARGATLRFRWYAWRYAAGLWSENWLTQIAGQGAGSYPRLAGQLAVYDKSLDPAAFMGVEIVEHAHNELFEVLAEIGLVGGVTFVGGLVATFAAAAALLRSAMPGPQRWLLLALVGSIVALLADSLVGVSLRLPGGAAIFFTLLGVVWGVCRATPDEAQPDEPGSAPDPGTERQPAATLRPSLAVGAILAATTCFAAAIGAGWLTLRNWSGVLLEQSATSLSEEGDREEAQNNVFTAQRRYAEARGQILRAAPRLLDPVRKVAARKLALQCQFGLARGAYIGCIQPAATAPHAKRRQRAIDLARQTHFEALWLNRTMPALAYTNVIAARSAEWLSDLYRATDPEQAGQWAQVAKLAWRRQRQQTRFDLETLLALTRYGASLGYHIGLLRDALRFGQALGPWLETLARLSQVPTFESQLALYVAAVGPITPETDLDSLIASMAPETHRLVAAWHGIHGDYATAAAEAGRAAQLYRPMRPRFPTLYSVARAEQAEYVLRGSVADAPRAIELLREAINTLPDIQRQKYDQMARPFRYRLAFCLLVNGETDQAVHALRAALGDEAADPQVVAQAVWVMLREAAAVGVSAEGIERMRQRLRDEFPSLWESPHGPE